MPRIPRIITFVFHTRWPGFMQRGAASKKQSVLPIALPESAVANPTTLSG
ncbi:MULTISPECIES: hypothetical protein [unclassified Pseudomonas]|nr:MULTISPECIES: hypothetical protein [unclassified Pseudomonas]MCO7519020.1 hypothetical protein [Pseudomonas sp. 1]MCO7541103.1 hypothetical protein [Pseudomonas sp. VA159-2]